MALPDSFKHAQGTAKSWKSTGGDYTITLTSLANAAGREGAKGDLGALRARQWYAFFTTSVAVAAANGLGVELWWLPSTSATAGTDNPANATGTDAGITTPDEYKLQAVLIGVLALSNAKGTGVQKQGFVFEPPTQYGMPFIVNKSGQALGSTAGDHEITLTPIEETVEE